MNFALLSRPDSDVLVRGIACAWLMGLAIVCAAAEMPKIQVSADRRGFEDAHGKPWAPIGVNYYRPGTGWAPQVWKKFDAEATRADFKRMREAGVNCVRVFLTYGSFYSESGVLDAAGLEKFDAFLRIAEQTGIYVHPTGPDHWEGLPKWKPYGIEEESAVGALAKFWELFAARYRGRNVIFAYDLRNEPEVPWTSPTLQRLWGDRVRARQDAGEQNSGWGKIVEGTSGSLMPPPDNAGEGNQALLEYQKLREDVADTWTRRQVEAIRKADPRALVTVGLIQWSVPGVLSGSVKHYSGFNPRRQAQFLDFMEVHFYPLADGAFEYKSDAEEEANLAYLESVVREVALAKQPVVLAEFGWYGGGKPRFDGGKRPAATEEQQARYCRRVVETSARFATGWLNWGFYDQPEATDCSELTGLFTADGRAKKWGESFRELVGKYTSHRAPAVSQPEWPSMDWSACLTSREAGARFQREYLKAFNKRSALAE